MDDGLREKLESLIPKNLDDVFRINRDKGRLYAATPEELDTLRGSVPIVRPKGKVIDYWFLTIHLTLSAVEMKKTYLVGYNRVRQSGWITSYLQTIDGNAVYTHSGSVYLLGGEPVGADRYDLPFLCAALREWGFGQAFGIPEFFF